MALFLNVDDIQNCNLDNLNRYCIDSPVNARVYLALDGGEYEVTILVHATNARASYKIEQLLPTIKSVYWYVTGALSAIEYMEK